MVKMILIGVLVALSTLGGSYAGMMLAHSSSRAAEHAEVEALEIVKFESLSIPVLRNGKVHGYVLGRFAFGASPSEVKKNRTAMTMYVSEAVFTSIYEEDSIDFSALRPLQVDALAERIVKKANGRIGQPLIKQAFIENLSFLGQEEVRCQKNQ